MNNTLTQWFLEELGMEARATRACLERFDEKLYDWKPHDKSMKMGYLALVCADIPQWIVYTIKKGEVDFATYPHSSAKTAAEMVALFDKNMEEVREALKSIDDKELEGMFYLKNNGQELMKDTKKNTIGSTINHLVHHRGQLTVYMRLNNILVPSIYGPSADDNSF